MKSKVLSKLLLICAAISVTVLFVGCEPNVPANDNESDDTSITTLQGNTSGTEDDVDDVTEDENKEEEKDEDKDKEEDDTVTDEHEDGVEENTEEDVTSAVEENTSTADFDEVTQSQYQNQLSAFSAFTGFSSLASVEPPNSPSYDGEFSHLPNEPIRWGLGKEVDGKKRPIDAVNANLEYGRFDAIFIGEESNRVYLTFDEGYENGCTADILDTLKKKGVKATFFVTYDYCESAPKMVERMIREGHTVGNHSCSHPSFPKCSVEEIRDEIGTLHDYVKENFNYEMSVIRFPQGEFSERSLFVAQDMGYKSVFWSFAYRDWVVDDQPEPSEALDKIQSALHPGGIYLLHAVSQTNTAILGELIDYWHGEGFKLGLLQE